MFTEWKKIIFILTAVIIVLGVSAPPSHAIWHVYLNEHFNRDQQNENNLWPWITDLRNRVGWGWNPRPPHPRTSPAFTDYSWGVQDYLFNSHITPHDEINQSIWCAYTNRGNVDQPRWPEDDDYMNLQNAWTWWGPFSLEEATAAAVSYWVYLDLDNFSYDSLTVVVVDNPNLLTLNGDDFHDNVTWGATFNHRVQEDWAQRIFYLDSLILGPAPEEDDEDFEYQSVIGSEEVYLAFAWHSNRYGVTGMGAFVDDVIISWDDGLFELAPLQPLFGYPEPEEDTIFWEDEWPLIDDEVYFRLPYSARGIGEIPEFDISLYLDNELIYTEAVSIVGSNEIQYVTADTLWTVTEGEHTLRWEIDTPVDEGGVVEEADEDNNVEELIFNVQYNPPPIIEFTEQNADTVVLHFPADPDENVLINWSIQDDAPDDEFRVFLFWTHDTSGLAEAEDQNALIFDTYNYFWRDFNVGLGAESYEWEAENDDDLGYSQVVPKDSLFQIVAFISDGFPGNYDVGVSQNWYRWEETGEVSVHENPADQTPTEFGIATAFPNPFNQTLKVEYSLTQSSDIILGVYDMAGRFVTELASGITTAGKHSIAWNPGMSPAGVYLIRLNSGDQTSLKKVVYMP